MVNDPQQPRPSGHGEPIVALIAAFALVDLVTPNVSWEDGPGEFLAPALGGAISGQLGVLAVWAVLGPQRVAVRWPVSLLVTTLLWVTFLVGMLIAYDSGREILQGTMGEMILPLTFRVLDRGELVALVAAIGTLMLPLTFLAVQLPLWILRAATGCRIVLAGTQRSSSRPESRQFRLRHILGATSAVAVALGLAGLGLSTLGHPAGNADLSVWLGLMLACLACSVWSAFSILPCLWAVFVARDKAGGAMIIAMYVALMSVLVLVVGSTIAGPSPRFGEAALYLSLSHGGLALVLLGGLHVARSCGYVLLRPGRPQPPATPTDSSTDAAATDPSRPPL